MQAQVTQTERDQIREDVSQDGKISELQAKVERMDARVSKQWDQVQANANIIAGMQGENRMFGGLLALLSGCSIVFQVRSNRKKEDG